MHAVRALLAGFLTIFAATSALAEGCSKPFRLGWTEIPPAFFAGDKGGVTGVDIDIARAVFGRAGCRFVAEKMPFKRYVNSVKFGEVDVIMSASRNAEREAFSYFSVPYRREQMVLFVSTRQLDLKHVDSLPVLVHSGARVALGRGMWLGGELSSLREKNRGFRDKTLMIDSYPAMLRAILAGRVDGLIGDSIGVRFLIAEAGLETQVTEAPLVVNDNNVHFMFSRKSVSINDVALINGELEKFVGSPEHRAILARYPVGDIDAMMPGR